ncbi:MAG: hypothetical protein HY303_02510, partial [Candidatus Wallbacteria bacterium]|nr:hypothetical protein [Candidatus Wallbacteria bacterium]
ATIIRGQKGISVKARILNGGEHSVNLSSSSLQLTGPGGVSTTGGFTITPSPANVSIISGSSTATLAFTLDSNPTTQLGAMTIQATVSGTDALSGGATSDSTAETPGSWSVLSPASLVVNSVTLSAASALPGTTGIVVAGGQVTLRYSVSVLASARLGVTTIDATVTVKDKVTGASPTKTGVDAPGLWTVRTVTGLALGRMTVTPELAVPGQTGLVVTVPVQNAGLTAAQLTLSITSPAAGAIVFAGDPIPFAGTAIDDANVALDPALLTWRSNLSGTIGAGTHFTRSLPVGVHTITFNASNGSTLSGSTSLTLNVRSAPTSADTLSISGSLLAIGTGSPVADGFRVTFTNARGGSSATGVTTGGLGHYSAVFSGAGVANVGDSLAVAVTSADGRALAATPAALALSNQDILTGNRAADLSVAVSPEAVLALRSGLNLVSLAVRPTTTGGDALTAADLAAVTGSTFVIRAARGRFEAYLVPSGSGAFALEGSQGYFIFSPSTRTLHLSGTPWDPRRLDRDQPHRTASRRAFRLQRGRSPRARRPTSIPGPDGPGCQWQPALRYVLPGSRRAALPSRIGTGLSPLGRRLEHSHTARRAVRIRDASHMHLGAARARRRAAGARLSAPRRPADDFLGRARGVGERRIRQEEIRVRRAGPRLIPRSRRSRSSMRSAQSRQRSGSGSQPLQSGKRRCVIIQASVIGNKDAPMAQPTDEDSP